MNHTEEFLYTVGYLVNAYMDEASGVVTFEELRDHIMRETGQQLSDEDLRLGVQAYEG